MRIMETVVRGQLAAKDGVAALQQRLNREDGASAIEYALLVGLIAVVIIVAVTTLGKNVSTKLSDAANALT
jgi:pilus assembly protein Flp/PilA